MNFSNLLHWAVVFLGIALLAALLGFGGLAGTAVGAAKLLFWVAIVLAIVSFLASLSGVPERHASSSCAQEANMAGGALAPKRAAFGTHIPKVRHCHILERPAQFADKQPQPQRGDASTT